MQAFQAWRRKRDSNPRYVAVKRFSRPPRSTTLPFLRCKSTFFFYLTSISRNIFRLFLRLFYNAFIYKMFLFEEKALFERLNTTNTV